MRHPLTPYSLALTVLLVTLAVAVLFAVARHGESTDQLYEAWIQEVTPPRSTARPNLPQHYTENPRFRALVNLGNPAVPYLSNKIEMYLSTANHIPGPSADRPKDATNIIRLSDDYIERRLPPRIPRDADVYLAYAIMDIMGWNRSDFTNYIRLPMDHDAVAAKVLERLRLDVQAREN